ncbi:MAG TPA: hypothetical protein VGD42_02155 [Lysobacter sp.]
MFPSGWPGVGLLLLRIAVATGTVQGAGAHGLAVPTALPWCLSAMVLAGALTPLACMAGCLLAIVVLSHEGLGAPSTVALLTGLSAAGLALLGPGAISLDARLFGRRVLRLPGIGH